MNKNKILAVITLGMILLTACLGPTSQVRNLGQQPLQVINPDASPLLVDSAEQNNTQSESSPVIDETHTEDEHSDTPHTSDVDLTHLEVGDGKYSTSPQAGYVYVCRTTFNGNGAQGTGDWMNGDGTWDATKKAVVDGSVMWPHNFTVSLQGNQRVLTGNDLPDHPTGTFPVSSSDDAYAVDRNPNSIKEQSITLTLPANPTAAAQPNCVGGEVGIMLSGVLIFNAFDAEGHDAVAHEVQDGCDGHPQNGGFYHYHSLSDCIVDNATGHSALLGYAFDGYGIYGYYGEDGKELTNDDLDACHGHTHMIEWDGQMVEMYHYHATHEFPYVLGCFHGTAAVKALSAGGSSVQPQQGGQPQLPQQNGQPQQPPQTGTGQGQPPLEAINACSGLSQGAACSVGPMSGICMTPPNTTQLACIPTGGPP